MIDADEKHYYQIRRSQNKYSEIVLSEVRVLHCNLAKLEFLICVHSLYLSN